MRKGVAKDEALRKVRQSGQLVAKLSIARICVDRCAEMGAVRAYPAERALKVSERQYYGRSGPIYLNVVRLLRGMLSFLFH